MHLLSRAESSARLAPIYNGATVPLSEGGRDIVITNIAFMILVTVWTGLRLYSRRIKRFGLMIEDYFYLCALVLQSIIWEVSIR